MPTKAEQEQQAELRQADRGDQVAIEPDHEALPPAGKAKSIQALLVDVMRDVKAIEKEGEFTGGARYRYRGIEHVLKAVGPAFRTHGVVTLPRLIRWERDSYLSGKNNTPMTRYVVEVEYAFVGPAGDRLFVVSGGEGSDSSDKALSKAMAVALRVALLQLLAIPTKDEDGESERAEAVAAPDMRTINLARQHLDAARTASTVEQVGMLWEGATADGSILVELDGKTLADHLKEIGTQLQGQVTP